MIRFESGAAHTHLCTQQPPPGRAPSNAAPPVWTTLEEMRPHTVKGFFEWAAGLFLPRTQRLSKAIGKPGKQASKSHGSRAVKPKFSGCQRTQRQTTWPVKFALPIESIMTAEVDKRTAL